MRRVGSLAELTGQCDFVSVHTPLTAEACGLTGVEAFAAVKRGMIPINTARPGGDIDAILAAGLDVLPEEPANSQRRLIAAWQKNQDRIRRCLLLTPYSAVYTPESPRDNRAFAARTAVRSRRDGRLETLLTGGSPRLTRTGRWPVASGKRTGRRDGANPPPVTVSPRPKISLEVVNTMSI
jgi:phosphoglycerate dehydrogenase-like enzyme